MGDGMLLCFAILYQAFCFALLPDPNLCMIKLFFSVALYLFFGLTLFDVMDAMTGVSFQLVFHLFQNKMDFMYLTP